MKQSEIVVVVSDSLSGLVDGIGVRSVDQFLEEKVDTETSLFGAIYSMYSSMLKRGVRWTKACITMRINDVLCSGMDVDG